VLRLERLQGGYDDRFAIDIDDLTIHEGEVVVIMGRNGSGKSTLLRLVMGLIKTRRGRVFVRGKPVTGKPAHEISAQLAYLPQDPNALLFSDTVLDELNVTRANHQLPKWTPNQADSHLTRLRLAGLGSAYPRDLSVGQRERAAIGAVTATRPVAILLDEPTRGLDQQSKAALADLLRDWKRSGCAVVIVTHDAEFAAEVADRVAVMAAGRLTTDGDPRVVLTTTPGLAPLVARIFPDTNWLTVEDVPIPGARPEP
jgi:energy-coupling factor transport system ATP-binding protein